jgi:hypothetical protein
MVSVCAVVFSVNNALQAIGAPSSGAVPMGEKVSLKVVGGVALALQTVKISKPKANPTIDFPNLIKIPPDIYAIRLFNNCCYALAPLKSNILVAAILRC